MALLKGVPILQDIPHFRELTISPNFNQLCGLCLDNCVGLEFDHLRQLRGHKNLRRLSLVGMTIVINREMDEIFASLRSLVYLNINECIIDSNSTTFLALSQSCSTLKSLMMAKTKGINDYLLSNLASCVERFRSLQVLDLSGSSDFTDEGLLVVIQASGSILTELRVDHCRQLTTLSLASLRGRMSALHTLNISFLLIGCTAYEWISEGCRSLINLNLTKASELNDETLTKIGRWCRFLKNLNVSNCVQITDAGIVGFFSSFDGGLVSLDLTGCVACSQDSMTAITQHVNTIRGLEALKLNGLSRISGACLKEFWNRTLIEGNLQVFEMSCSLKSSNSHRRSMMPHFSDEVLLSFPGTNSCRMSLTRKLTTLKIVGAGQTGDVGLCLFLQQSGETLMHLNVSYCYKVTDVTLLTIAQTCRVLHTLILTGCVHITDVGISALGAGDNYSDIDCDIPWREDETAARQMYPLSLLSTPSFFTATYTQSNNFRRGKLFPLPSSTSLERNMPLTINASTATSTANIKSNKSLISTTLHVEDLEKSSSLPSMKQTLLSSSSKMTSSSMPVPVLSNKHSANNVIISTSSLKKTGKLRAFSTLNSQNAATSLTNRSINSNFSNSIQSRSLHSLCRNTLHTIELSGCGKITDTGLRNLVRGVRHKIESLGIRSCDLITDKGVQAIARFCAPSLQSLDMMNLDYVTVNGLKTLITRCRILQTLNCDGCAFTAQEFARVINAPLVKTRNINNSNNTENIKGLIFAQTVPGRCRLEPRVKPVFTHNAFVYRESLKRIQAVRVLQRFAYFILHCQEKLRSQVKDIASAWRLRRIFTYFALGIRRSRHDRAYQDRIHAVHVLQRILPRLYAIRMARRLLVHKKRVYSATITLQRVFRGFSVRNRLFRRFQRLFHFYNKMGHLVHKYWLLFYAKRLHRFILAVQGFARMVPVRACFLRIRKCVIALQRRLRGYLIRRTRQIVRRKRMEEVALALNRRRHYAARKLQRNLKACLFNKYMAPFIFTCCVYARNEWDEQNWAALLVQRRYRGWIVRYRKYKILVSVTTRYIAAKKLQTCWRRHREFHVRYPAAIIPYRRAMHFWKKFLYRLKPRLCLGRRYVRRIQRWYRNWSLIWQREQAATRVQSLVRQYQAKKYVQERYLLHVEEKADVIKRALWKWHWKCYRLAMKRRQHMAAYRIYLMVEKPFQIRRLANRKIENERLMREHLRTEKQRIFMDRCRDTVKRIRKRYREQMARRIQRFFKLYKPIMHAYYKVIMEEKGFNISSSAYHNNNNNSTGHIDVTTGTGGGSTLGGGGSKGGLDAPDTADYSTMSRKMVAALNTAVTKPLNLLKNALKTTVTLVQKEELIPKKDLKKLSNAILSYQVKSILQEGIIDLHITVGDLEASNFELRQVQLRNASLPFFERLSEDLSHHLNLSLYLWVMYGTGKECICSLEISPRPPNYSNAGMKIREEELRAQHLKLVWHPHTHFEIRGEKSILLNKAAFAIEEIKIVNTPADYELMTLQDKYRLVQDLTSIGFNQVSVWVSGRRAEEDEAMYKFNQITAYGWCDDRLIRTVKSFLLTEEDVFNLRRTFQRILKNRHRASVPNQDIFQYIDFKWNSVGQWAIAAVQPRRRRELTFSEYVHFVCYFVMLSAKDLARFLFTSSDVEEKGFLRREQFATLINLLAEGSPFNVKQWEYQYELFYDKKLKSQFISNFSDFVYQNPGVLWQPQLLQQRLKKYNLGIKYWDKKMEQYRVIRENMGIKQL